MKSQKLTKKPVKKWSGTIGQPAEKATSVLRKEGISDEVAGRSLRSYQRHGLLGRVILANLCPESLYRVNRILAEKLSFAPTSGGQAGAASSNAGPTNA